MISNVRPVSLLAAKQPAYASPVFGGEKFRRNYHYAPKVFEENKDNFVKSAENLKEALNNMQKGTFTLENKNWGSPDKKVKQGEISIIKNKSEHYIFLVSGAERIPWYEVGRETIGSYHVTADTDLDLDDPELTEEVKQRTRELGDLFDNLPHLDPR